MYNFTNDPSNFFIKDGVTDKIVEMLPGVRCNILTSPEKVSIVIPIEEEVGKIYRMQTYFFIEQKIKPDEDNTGLLIKLIVRGELVAELQLDDTYRDTQTDLNPLLGLLLAVGADGRVMVSNVHGNVLPFVTAEISQHVLSFKSSARSYSVCYYRGDINYFNDRYVEIVFYNYMKHHIATCRLANPYNPIAGIRAITRIVCSLEPIGNSDDVLKLLE